MSNQIQLFQYGPIQDVNRDRTGELPDALVSDCIFPYIPDRELVLLQVVNKKWKNYCLAHFELEADTMTQAGVPMTARTLAYSRIHSMDELMSRINEFASRLTLNSNGLFICALPFNLQNRLIIKVESFPRNHKSDVTGSCIVTSKDLAEVNPKITITSRTGITRDVSFYENLYKDKYFFSVNYINWMKYSILGKIPAIGLSHTEISEGYSKLEDFIVHFFSSPLAAILGTDLNSQAENLKSKIMIVADKLPKHLNLEIRVQRLLLRLVQMTEGYKNVFDLFLNPTTDTFDQFVKTPEFKGAVSDFFSEIDNLFSSFLNQENMIPEDFLAELLNILDRRLVGLLNQLYDMDSNLVRQNLPSPDNAIIHSDPEIEIGKILNKRMSNLIAEKEPLLMRIAVKSLWMIPFLESRLAAPCITAACAVGAYCLSQFCRNLF